MKTINLSIGYATRIVASGINMELEAGKLLCLIGENGVGKSTLLRTLAGFQKPISGELLIDGVQLQDIPKRELAKKIAVVLTDKLDVLNTTVYELVAMGRMPYTGFFGRLSEADKAIVEDSLKITGVEPSRKVSNLSDGERQKVMIARALAQQTPYIFLDESTAFLDYPSKVRTMEMLKKLAHDYNKTILLSTHDLEIALDIADRLVMMEKTPSNLPQGEGLDSQVKVKIGNPKKRNNEKIPSFTSDALLTDC
ncbi:MAG: ABC transporter ATP-binding protein [Bacteroidaceae bacterium]|nr:ABC transporter ATP-binding protein [Bacteroidaceae bacterium]